MSTDEKSWYNTLALIPKESRGVALIAIVANTAVLATIPLLPSQHRIYGFIVFACVLVGTLIGTVVVVRRSTSQDHNQPSFAVKVRRLKDKLVADRFMPQLIIAIPRDGLGVAGLLASELGDQEIVPVISLVSSRGLGFDNTFNHLNFNRQDFDSATSDPINILIVDDICASGHTLDTAKTYVESSINRGDFVIKTAAISFYHSPRRAIAPSFFVDRPEESIRGASGDVEPMQN